MSGKCNPLHLPIVVEPKCADLVDNCNCNTSVCSVNCDTDTSIYTQGTYQNQCSKTFDNVPRLPIASLSNVRNLECQPQSAVRLNTVCIPWCDFLRLFYPTNSFRISLTNTIPCATFFAAQTYEDTTSPCLKFYLTDFVRKAWEAKCNTPVNNLPLKTNILLEKDASNIRSIYSANSVTALTLDEAISTLISSDQIAPADSTSRATVIFTIEYLYYFKPLDIAVQVNFNYKTAIPCYKNIEPCGNWCPAYSNCNNCSDVHSEIKKSQIDFSDNDSTINGDNSSQTELDSFNEQMKELISRNDDNKSFVSFEESKW